MKQPNILLLMTDQQRADYVGWAESPQLATPQLDRLAEGVVFTDCATVNPICTPARTALLTGKYSRQVGTLAMSGDLSLQHPTYLRALQEAGYWTAAAGKLHWLQGWPWGAPPQVGHDLVALKPQLKQFGWDELWETSGKELLAHNFCDYGAHLAAKGLLDAYRDHILAAKDPPRLAQDLPGGHLVRPWPFDEQDYVDCVTTDRVLEAIACRPQDRPFFIFGSFCGPHPPYDPPARYLQACSQGAHGGDRDTGRATAEEETVAALRRAYRAMIALIDEQVGRIIARLEGERLLESTVILFISDHGEMLGDHGRMNKMVPYWQSVSVPCAIRHPHHLRRARVDAPVESIDLTATILELAGLDPQQALSKAWPRFHNIVPCRSLLPLVDGSAAALRDFTFSESVGQWSMIRSSRYAYVRYHGAPDPDVPDERLYDRQADPDELEDRSADPALRGELDWHRRRLLWVLERHPAAQLQWADVAPGAGR